MLTVKTLCLDYPRVLLTRKYLLGHLGKIFFAENAPKLFETKIEILSQRGDCFSDESVSPQALPESERCAAAQPARMAQAVVSNAELVAPPAVNSAVAQLVVPVPECNAVVAQQVVA
jgi:hypothetical protein